MNTQILIYISAILISCSSKTLSSQSRIVLIFYGNKTYMEKSTNELSYTFKKGIKDGLYIAYYDKHRKDTAIMCTISNGLINGILTRWDEKKNYVNEKCEYKNGKMNGVRHLYFNYNGNLYTNIEKWENDVLLEYIKVEW